MTRTDTTNQRIVMALRYHSGPFCSLYMIRSTSISSTKRMVSGGQITSMRMVSCIFWTRTTALSFLISRTIVSRTTYVSVNLISSVTNVVSTLTIVSFMIVGSFAIARFRCHDAPHDWRTAAVITTHTNRIRRDFGCCNLVVLRFLNLQPIGRNRFLNLPFTFCFSFVRS